MTNPRSVLHVVTTINRGGAENHLVALATAQARRGWSVTVAYLKGDGYWADTLRAVGVDVVSLEWSGYTDLGVVGRIRNHIDLSRPSILHAHLPAAEVLTRLAHSRSAARPTFVISKHNDDPIATPMFWLGGFWAERGAVAVISISHAVARYLQNQHRLPADKITPIHYGLDPAPYDSVTADTIASIRREWGVSDDELVIGTVARITAQKRIDVLIDAIALVRDRGLKPKLVVVGKGELENEMRQRARQRGIAVVWAGRREDIPAVMQAFDIFTLTSDYEGFGLVLLEAMASRRPIVATRVSAIPEIVVDGVTGALCKPGDAVDIAHGFGKLADATRRSECGAAGRRRLERDFTVDKMVEATLALYVQAQGS